MKKVLVIVMSMNSKEFSEEEEVIRQTWASDIISGKFPGMKVLFYKGKEKRKEHLNGDVLYIDSDDTLNGTYEKTVKTLEWCMKNEEFDFIVKTNTTTYINTGLMSDFIERLPDGDRHIYGSTYITNTCSNGILYFRGNFAIWSKNVVSDIIKTYNKRKCVDDGGIGRNLCLYYKKEKIDYYSRMREVDGAKLYDNFPVVKYSYDKMKSCIWFRLKSGTPGKDHGFLIDKMRSLHAYIKTEERPFIPQETFNENSIAEIHPKRYTLTLEEAIKFSKKHESSTVLYR